MEQKLLAACALLLVALNVFVCSWLLLSGDVFYNQDTARDLLLLESMTKKPLTLIGERALGIPGLFHGPLWLYINLPVFVLSGGNPVMQVAFWISLYLLATLTVFFVGKSFFGKRTGVLAAVLFSAVYVNSEFTLNNSFGALIVFPIFFLVFYRLIQRFNLKRALLAFFLLGLLIQFQIAFGGPILLATLAMLVLLRKFKVLSALPVLLVPLGTFLIYEFKYGFPQTSSLLKYMSTASSSKILDGAFLWGRVQFVWRDSIGFVTTSHFLPQAIFVGCLIFVGYKVLRGKSTHKSIYVVFTSLYLGYWLVTLLYKGDYWVWYHWQFSTLLIIIFCSTYLWINKKVFALIYVVFYLLILSPKVLTWEHVIDRDFVGNDTYSWLFFANLATSITVDAEGPFGYFNFSDDKFSYRTIYAFSYVLKNFPFQGAINEKMPTTYVLITSLENPDWWKREEVRIGREPDRTVKFENGYRFEKYVLNAKEIENKSDPNLIPPLYFR